MAKKVAEKLNLKSNPSYASIFRDLPPNADDAMKQRAEESLISAVLKKVEVKPVRQSSLVDVSFSDPDPKFAATVVNTLAQCYIEQSLDLRFAASQEAAVWLKEKLIEGRKKLEESEAKLNQYKRDHNIVALDDKESITAQKLEQLNKDLIAAQTHRMEAETRFKEVSRGQPISQVLNNPLIQTLKGQEAKIIAEQSELSRKFGPEHPRMIRLNNELAATRGKIGAEMGQIVQAIKNEYYMAKAQEENLKGALEKQKGETQDLGDRNIEYRVLLRDVETNRALYENMLKSLKTTTASRKHSGHQYPHRLPGHHTGYPGFATQIPQFDAWHRYGSRPRRRVGPGHGESGYHPEDSGRSGGMAGDSQPGLNPPHGVYFGEPRQGGISGAYCASWHAAPGLGVLPGT